MTPRPETNFPSDIPDLILQNPIVSAEPEIKEDITRDRDSKIVGGSLQNNHEVETSDVSTVAEANADNETNQEIDPGVVIPSSGFFHPELGFLPDESFNLELTESNDAFSGIQVT